MKIEFQVDADLADTTVQWVYWNNQGPPEFEPTGTLATFTLSTSVANAVAANGFELGDTLLVKYGYGGTQTIAMEDTLTNSVGNLYSVAISNMPFDAALGLYYQYYKVKNEYNTKYISILPMQGKTRHWQNVVFCSGGAVDGGTLHLMIMLMKEECLHLETPLLLVQKLQLHTQLMFGLYYQIASGDS